MTNDTLPVTEYFYVQLRQLVQVALPLESTTEVISVTRKEICPIPGVAPALLGVVNQRGRLLWVLELSDLLKLPPSLKRSHSQDRLTLLVITANSTNYNPAGKAQQQLGCVISDLKGIAPLNPEQFQAVSAKVPSEVRSFVSSITEIEQLPVAILNVNAVLAAVQASVLN